MKRIYLALLWLYPAKYRASFAAEMTDVFLRASGDAQQRRWPFNLRELTGLMQGAFFEHLAGIKGGDRYLNMPAGEHFPDEIASTKAEIQSAIRAMEGAIAQHDFPKARFYSDREREARARLNRLTDGGLVSCDAS